jgi:hypothetical protein
MGGNIYLFIYLFIPITILFIEMFRFVIFIFSNKKIVKEN